VLPFEEYVRVRAVGLIRLGYLLSGNARAGRDLALDALVRARRQWSRIEEQPDEVVEQELVQDYLAWWRRAPRPRADHPLAPLSRTERAVLVLRYYRGYSEAQIADAIGGAVRRHLLAHHADPAALAEFVETLPAAEGLLEGVAARGRALSRRRSAIAGGIAVVVLATAGVLGATRPYPPQLRQTPETAVSATISAPPQPIRLVPTEFSLPAFPYELSYLPRDPGPSAVFKKARELLLEYADISLTLTPQEPPRGGRPDQVTVAGQAAKLYSFQVESRVDLTLVWRAELQWLTLHTFGISVEEALCIANGVRPGRVAMQPLPFTIKLAPERYSVQAADPWQLCIGLGYGITAGTYGLCVSLLESEKAVNLDPNRLQRTTINGLRVEVVEYDALRSELYLFLGTGKVLMVRQNALTPNSKLTADDLVRFAAAVQVNPAAA
jgi:hypothetical protein